MVMSFLAASVAMAADGDAAAAHGEVIRGLDMRPSIDASVSKRLDALASGIDESLKSVLAGAEVSAGYSSVRLHDQVDRIFDPRVDMAGVAAMQIGNAIHWRLQVSLTRATLISPTEGYRMEALLVFQNQAPPRAIVLVPFSFTFRSDWVATGYSATYTDVKIDVEHLDAIRARVDD
jgi:hypothetical protein